MVQKLIADWAATHPHIRTFAVWIANCRHWHGELEARLGRQVRLAWIDPDLMGGVEGSELVYDCINFSRLPVQ